MSFAREVFLDTERLLQRLYRQSRHHQVRQRSHCIILRSQGYGIALLMEIFLVSRKTLYNWFNSWEERGILGLYHRPGQGRKPTFSAEEMEQIRFMGKRTSAYGQKNIRANSNRCYRR